MAEKTAIAKQRDNTWNGVLPGDNNGFDSVPFNRKNTGTVQQFPETSKAGIKVSDVDLVGPIGRKTFATKHGLSVNAAPDYTNTNYPTAPAAPTPVTSVSTPVAPSGDTDTASTGSDDTDI
jgi:hypothetical protein